MLDIQTTSRKTVLAQPVPTNIIFGFLGAGKTTAILNLISRMPTHERWAVLVNEFGEVGIDGKIIAQTGISIKEIAGGCLCCAAGVPFQVGLNELIRSARPDRLIIEPTGLGHPREIIAKLSASSSQSNIVLKNSITLVDPRKLSDHRYLDNVHFMAQIDVADVVLASKSDLCSEADINKFWSFMEAYQKTKTFVGGMDNSYIDLEWLEGVPSYHQEPASHLHHDHASSPKSYSWAFPSNKCFDYDDLLNWAGSFSSLRLKAVVNTGKGRFVMNKSDDDALSMELVDDQVGETVVEVIGASFDLNFPDENSIEKSLENCIKIEHNESE